MTPKIIELKQAPVVLVELEDAPIKVWDSFANGFIYTEIDGYIETFYLDDICLDSKCMGLLSNITEEQFAECVETSEYFDPLSNLSTVPVYKNYMSDTWGWSSKYSFFSLLESEKVYVGENPLQHLVDKLGHGTLDNLDQDYAEAESRTINPERTVVLIKR